MFPSLGVSKPTAEIDEYLADIADRVRHAKRYKGLAAQLAVLFDLLADADGTLTGWLSEKRSSLRLLGLHPHADPLP